ncbi:hypothetical protein LTR05_008145 [Lithohypha guttulata]|uniref:MPN domain-containing protein n=1 Tax=Lithohypha guttulata TaxID=1690604 RepID=A0AAN7YD43_9EURO|nr:hypothetical protein LTR05_008145 [Lithohypha guttulata]
MALTIGSVHHGKGIPKNVAQLVQDASNYEFNALVPLKYWLNTASNMIKQAHVYLREGDDEMAYFLLFRHAHLFLSNLSTHPQVKPNDPLMQAAQDEVKKNLKALELLKPRINRRYEEYVHANQSKARQREEDAARRRADQGLPSPSDHETTGHNSHEKLSGHDNTDLAARLAGLEFSKRGPSRRAYPTGSSMPKDRDDLAAQMEAVRRRFDSQTDQPSDDYKQQRQAYIANNIGYSYPTIPSQKPQQAQRQVLEPTPSRSGYTAEPAQPPVLPPKPRTESNVRASILPPRPEKAPAAPVLNKETVTGPTYTFAPAAYLENGTALRTIFLPSTLRTTFLRLAYQNTLKNVETCGFLAGTLRANALFVSTLIIPKQTATSDTCEMTDESELFDYVDQHDLMVLGWIHTHPTQTCFMSSRDLHTHSGYQMMLAESIAIVCAPSKGDTSHGGEWGAYRLTDPPGKMAILKCDKPGIFHPHDVDNIYTDAMKPGHVMEISDMDFEIVDLRK